MTAIVSRVAPARPESRRTACQRFRLTATSPRQVVLRQRRMPPYAIPKEAHTKETRTKQNSRRHECATGSEDFSLPPQALQSSGVQKERRTSRSTQKLVTLSMALLTRQSNRVVVRQNPHPAFDHNATVLHWLKILPTVFAAHEHNAVIGRRHRPSEES